MLDDTVVISSCNAVSCVHCEDSSAAYVRVQDVREYLGDALWIVGTETPAQFRKKFSDVYRVLRRLGAQDPCSGDANGLSADADGGGSYDDA